MNVLRQPTLQAIASMVFAVALCTRLDLETPVALAVAAAASVLLGIRPIRPFVLGASLGCLSWCIHWHPAPSLITGEARVRTTAAVVVTSFRQGPSGAIGEGNLLELGGVDADLHVRLLSDDLLMPGTVWRGHVSAERRAGAWALDSVDPRWLEDRRGGGIVMRLLEPTSVDKPPWWRWPQVALIQRRLQTENLLLTHLKDPWRGLALALATGNKGWIDEDMMQEFVDTGTSHVLAISGLHFGIVVSIAWAITSAFARRFRFALLRWGESRLAAVGTLIFATVYVGFVGAPASACRAWFVVLCLCVGHMSYRRPCSLHAIAWAAGCALMMDPLQLCDLGFQLSFAATLGIVLFSRNMPTMLQPPVFGEERTSRKWIRHCGVFVGVSWSANLATAPVLLAQTGALPLSSLLTNLVVVPLVSVLVFPPFIAGLALAHVFENIGLWLCGASLNLLVEATPILGWFAHTRTNMWVPGVPPMPVTFLFVAAVAFLLHRLCWGRAVPTLMAIGLVLVCSSRRPDFRVVFFDVGQGDSTLVEVDDRSILIDAGGRRTGPDVGRSRVIPALRRLGVGDLDHVIVTHPDLDHSGGIGFVLRHVHTERLWLNTIDAQDALKILVRMAKRAGVTVEQISGRRPLSQSVTLLAPNLTSRNDRSVITEIRHPNGSVLLTADMEVAAEQWWLSQPGSKRFDVVKVPHHGSTSSSTLEFVRRTHPIIASISAGRNNRFHHPSLDVTSRWARESTILDTKDLGGIELVFEPDQLIMRSSRGP